jgi:GNAT superfamily N-acetyltransferase
VWVALSGGHLPSDHCRVHQVAELDDEQTALAFPAMKELRPHLADVGEFVARVRRQRAEGFRLAGSFSAEAVVAVAGFRCGENLAMGRNLYVDDLVTMRIARRQGHASALLRWLDEEAGRQGCAYVHLDSATHRHDAHRRYLSSGYIIPALHFAKEVPCDRRSSVGAG